MKKACSFTLILIIAICFTSIRSYAEGLRNTDYATVEAGAFKFGDELIDDIFGTYINLYGSANKMLNNNASVLGELEGIYGEGSSEGIDLTSTGVKGELSLVYLLMPNEAIDPYLIAGGLFEYNRIEASAAGETEDDDDSNAGFQVGGGIEFDLGEKAFGDIALVYQNIGDFDSLTPNVRFGYTLSEKAVLLLTAGYAIDEEDMWARLGVGVKL